MLRQGPSEYEQPGTRWRLAPLLAACSWLRLKSLPGLSQLLKRLKISWKRARAHVHSPDPDYTAKLQQVRFWVLRYQEERELLVVVYEDEFTFYRRPSQAHAYEQRGKRQPLAEQGYRSNTAWRIGAALNVWTGQVTYVGYSHLTLEHLRVFYQKLVDSYPQAQQVKLIQDNWSIHYHPDVLAALQPQSLPFGVHRPGNWSSEPKAKTPRLNLPIDILALPTYAPWTNPIEKLWRLVYQEVLHLHRYQDDWAGLKQAVHTFLDQFATGSKDLLRYVGLEDPTRVYQALFPS